MAGLTGSDGPIGPSASAPFGMFTGRRERGPQPPGRSALRAPGPQPGGPAPAGDWRPGSAPAPAAHSAAWSCSGPQDQETGCAGAGLQHQADAPTPGADGAGALGRGRKTGGGHGWLANDTPTRPRRWLGCARVAQRLAFSPGASPEPGQSGWRFRPAPRRLEPDQPSAPDDPFTGAAASIQHSNDRW